MDRPWTGRRRDVADGRPDDVPLRRRRREIGIRSALGSTPAHTVRLVAWQGAVLVGAGAVLGLAGAAGATRLLTGMPYGVSPLNPATWSLAAATLAAVGLLAVAVPATRAARTDPLLAIRDD